jgi:hypothetical protein
MTSQFFRIELTHSGPEARGYRGVAVKWRSSQHASWRRFRVIVDLAEGGNTYTRAEFARLYRDGKR